MAVGPERPRFVADEPFPSYAYVPGRFPHPRRDPEGHAFKISPDEVEPPNPDRWQEIRPYLFGLDLFNHGYYWEAHEAWEAVWKACGRRGTAADFLKSLIKLAAAGVKAREGRPAGVARHGARAAGLFRGVHGQISGATYLGLDVGELIEFAERLERGTELPEPSDAAVKVVFDFRLRPER